MYFKNTNLQFPKSRFLDSANHRFHWNPNFCSRKRVFTFCCSEAEAAAAYPRRASLTSTKAPASASATKMQTVFPLSHPTLSV